ncbi:hypothetical protein [Saccharopolyspora phatthalungensis]|uniref:Uncharacterized protein n=1 Tax=Saccharopolyspora phatthalungensis TaxID=664693 RepID=A0A840Q323_9PSEU|nr:hypothetical protein [Saccharopolyspora phatthalungensis]MBB5154896.1 hypothetical protein [Saccharopolyspora phatthalungensis]
MRTAKRVLAAAAVGLPVLLGTAGTALAADGHPTKLPKASKITKQVQDQAEHNHTVQNNINVSPVTQVSTGGKGEQAAMTWTQQNNYNGTEQTEGEMLVDD